MTTELAFDYQQIEAICQEKDEEGQSLDQIFETFYVGNVIARWKIGRWIKEKVLENAQRAPYKLQLMEGIALRYRVDRSELSRCRQCYEKLTFEQICDARHKFAWTHVRYLLPLPPKEIATAIKSLEAGEIRTSAEVKEYVEKVRRRSGAKRRTAEKTVDAPDGVPVGSKLWNETLRLVRACMTPEQQLTFLSECVKSINPERISPSKREKFLDEAERLIMEATRIWQVLGGIEDDIPQFVEEQHD